MCILAVGAARRGGGKMGQLQWGRKNEDDALCDRRVVDGATGSAFLKEIEENLELPIRMLL